MLNQNRIMLLVTENCNLKCRYCYEHQKSAKKMTFKTAKSILDDSLNNVPVSTPIIIELFGGEAFANFPLIQKIDNYLQENYCHLDIKYETTTNGTLINGEVKEWLLARKNKFYIALSLDGTKKMHDLNRIFPNGEGSFDSIDIDFFIKNWPGCPAKMTVSELTLPYLADGVAYLDKLGFRCDATLSIGVDWDREKNQPILAEELNKLVTYYTEYTEKPLCTMLNQDLRLIFAPIDEDYRFCGAGLDMTCYDAEGGAYPCQGFAPISIGKDANEYRNFDEKNFRFTQKNMCKNCQWVRLCPNCYAANLQSTGDIQKVDQNLCQFYKMCILASAKIQWYRILKKDNLTYDDQLILKAISQIQNEMK